MNTLQLMIRGPGRRYRAARPSEICEAAAVYQVRAMVGERHSLSNPRATREFFRGQLAFREAEAFAVCFLDNRHRIIAFEVLFRGTIDGASVHPREVVRRALDLNAAAVILGHNHPSGVTEPSQADELITRRLKEALAMVEIRTLDHLIIGAGGEACSFAERGLL
jgi:DNA repair protein RadC